MKSTINILTHLLFILIFLSISIEPIIVTASAQNSVHLRVISSAENETVLEFTVDGFNTETYAQDGHTYHRILIDKTYQSLNVGEPQVPVFSTMIGLAEANNVDIQLITQETISYAGYNLPIVEGIHTQGDNLIDQQVALEVVTTPGSAETTSKQYLPENLVEVTQSGYLRDQAFAQITFHPIQYNVERKEIILNRYAIVKVTSNSTSNETQDHNRWNLPEFEAAMRNSLVNYKDLPRPSAREADKAYPLEQIDDKTLTENPSLKIGVTQEGLYQLTYGQMIDAGFDPSSIESSLLKITNLGTEVAVIVQDGGNGYIDQAGERILFFGVEIDNIYTNMNVYWLTYSAEEGKRMVEQNGTPGTADIPENFQNQYHAEEDTYYWQTMPDGEGQDHWFWGGRLSPNTQGLPYSSTHTVTLENIATESSLSANIRFALKGGTNDFFISPDHHTRVFINDQLVNDWYWNGFNILEAEQDINQLDFLVEGDNTIRFECIEVPDVFVDQIFVNWFEITYWDTYQAEADKLYFNAPSEYEYKFQVAGFTEDVIHVFDISDPTNVIGFTNVSIVENESTFTVEFQDTALEESRYLAISDSQILYPANVELDESSSWKTPDHAADYILITYNGFFDNIQPLVDHRLNQGLQVEVVKVQDLYDEFNYGIFNPQAIRSFLTYAYEYWQPPAPLYVVLVGDAYQDYKDNLNTGSVNYVPSQIVETMALGETPSDNWFVQIVGDDILPDMFIGRLSAQTTTQVDAIVQKIIKYEQDEDPTTWGTDALFVADNDDPSWETISDGFAELLPSWYTTKEVYLSEYSPGDATQDILDSINSGTMTINYLGHGSPIQWADENILNVDSVTLMNNADKHSFITIESCLNGYFTGEQSWDSLAEALQRHDNGAAMAIWAPSGLSYANGHLYMITELYTVLFQKNIHGLGQATTIAKWNVYDQSSLWSDLVNTYILFGDPATELGAEYADYIFIPFVNK